MKSSRHQDESKRPRVVVGGTRTFEDHKRLYRTMGKLVQNLTDPIICTGAGLEYKKVPGGFVHVGVDWHAEQWALSRYFTVKRFHAEWRRFGDSAGPRRNKEMCEYAAERKPAFAVFFWDGKSRGTKDCIAHARRNGLKVVIIDI